MLDSVIDSSIYMSHYEIYAKDVGGADQCGSQVAEMSVFAKCGCQGADRGPRRLKTAGISLCPGSEGNATGLGVAGGKSGVHGETPKELGGESEAICEEFRRNDQHDSHTSIGEFSSKRALTWLELLGQIVWSWSIALTDWLARRWLRFTGFWFREKRWTNLMMKYS